MKAPDQWWDVTWSPITGCDPPDGHHSEACSNCYARRMAYRLRGRFGYPADDPFRVTFHPDKLDLPLKWKKPRRIFVVSMGDLFHEAAKDEWLWRIFDRIAQRQRHQFLVLTKRPERMMNFITEYTFGGWVSMDRPLPNVMLGVTVENQDHEDRIVKLLQIPAAKRFVSYEPALGPVDFGRYLDPVGYIPCGGIPECECKACTSYQMWPKDNYGFDVTLDWIVCGGETGPGARPMDIAWARAVRDQCREAGVAFWMKKMSGGKQPPEDLLIREFPE